MEEVRIVKWEEKYHPAFVDLSVEWLEKYVSVEPADLELLNEPKKNILDGGGEIFFALLAGEAVGTVAMIPAGRNFELAKLAVTEAHKGKKIGDLLMKACLAFAAEKGAEKILLYTNHKLVPAIGLYQKYGFQQVDLGSNKYLESDMKMELVLDENH